MLKKKMRFSRALKLTTACIALSLPALANAQEAETTAAEEEANPDGEILVVAQGRVQALSDVPLAVSAVTAESLQNSGANDIRQLNQLAPSLLVSSTGSEANGSARIRGVGTVGDNPGLESSVAVFIDGVYRSRTGAGLNDLGEIDRIEVLRGPQGTLFGRNASAGLLSIYTKKPSFDFGANAEATYGNYDYMRLLGGVTGPISDKLAYRLDGVWSQRDGFYKNVDASGNVLNDINNRNRYFVRGQLLFEPTNDISFRLIGDYTHRREACCAATYISRFETYDTTAGPGDFQTRLPGEGGSPSGNRVVDILTSLGGRFPGATDPYNRLVATNANRSYEGLTEDYGISGELNINLGNATLTSITAYRDYKADGGGDLDYSNVDLLYRAADGNAYRQFKTFSQELRLQGTAFEDRLDWLIGGYFSHEKLRVSDNIQFGSQYGAFAACRIVALVSANPVLRDTALPGCMSATGRATITGAFGAAAPVILGGLDRLSTVNNVGDNTSNYYQTSQNYAFFTHNIINITDRLSLTLGLRYTNETKDFRATFNNNNSICPTQQAFFSPFLTGGATPLPAGTVQAIAQGIVNLTCQGNSSTSLNALNLTDQRKEDEFTGTTVLSWKPTDDLLAYASASRGYKAGGFNLDRSALGQPIFSPTDPRQFGDRNAGFNTGNLQFDAEKVKAYELGLKYSGGKFNLNLALFRQDFSDFQLNTFNGSVFLVQNVAGCSNLVGGSGADSDASGATGTCAAGDVGPGVRAEGVEAEAAIYPGDNVAITLGYTFAKTKFRNDLVGRNTGTPLDPALFLLPGDNLSNAPEHVVTSSVAWTPSIGSSGLSGLFYVDARMSSDYNTGSDLFVEKEQDGFFTVNARVGLRGADQKWAIELWAQNLTNENYAQVAFNTPFQGSNSRSQLTGIGSPTFTSANQLFSAFLAEPRTFGVTLRGKF